MRPRFESIELSYGCHHRPVRFHDEPRPMLIAGSNGSGKSTLLEALVRTLFGFDRRRGRDAGRLEARKPWSGEDMYATVVIHQAGERFEIRRDFPSDRVRVQSLDDGVQRFEGDGNPGGRNQESRRYRHILGNIIGLRDIEGYDCTLFVRQGALRDTALGEHLLRVAAGGHANVDSARHEIVAAHRVVTRRPIQAGAREAINPRELERLEEEIAAVRARLESAREAEDRRGPLAAEREQAAGRLDQLDAEIERLEAAQSAVARSGTAELEARQLRDWARKLERVLGELGRGIQELSAAAAQRRDAVEPGLYPDDFMERVARADVRWRDLEALALRPAWPAAGGLVLLAIATVLLGAGQPYWALGVAGVGALGLAAWIAIWLDTQRRRRAIRRELEDVLAGVPQAESLSLATRARRLGQFHAQRTAAYRLRDARRELADALRVARGLIRDVERGGLGPAGGEAEEPPTPRLPGQRTEARARALPERARDRMTQRSVDLERLGDASLGLPDGVPPTDDGIADALRQRRVERARVQAELQTVGQELLERGSPVESVDALEDALDSLTPRRDALARKADVLESAHALLTDAYDAFRARDQERLVRFVSGHVERLSLGRLGPVAADDILEDARVRAGDRALPLESPPLSFGEFHALLLGVRLGAADFLGGIGVYPPIILDEPFAHLDRERATAVWTLLSEIARERQVIVATQDELLLDALDVQPDVRLGD